MRKIDEAEKWTHRLKNHESSMTLPVAVCTLEKGDVFIREGAPCMRMQADSKFIIPETDDSLILIVNLVTGSCWHVSAKEQVWPCYKVELTYKSARRD